MRNFIICFINQAAVLRLTFVIERKKSSSYRKFAKKTSHVVLTPSHKSRDTDPILKCAALQVLLIDLLTRGQCQFNR
ncbi:unnamed protein product [Rhizophagus irregularis]|nr:unnamed protein product [Rhizophagus irregularis]